MTETVEQILEQVTNQPNDTIFGVWFLIAV